MIVEGTGVESGRAPRLTCPQRECEPLVSGFCCELCLSGSPDPGWVIHVDAHGITLALPKVGILVLLGSTPPWGQLQGFLKG